MIVTCHANHDSNLCMEGSPKQKHDWLPLKRFLSSKYLKSKLNIIFSNILPQTGNNDTGRELLINCLSFFYEQVQCSLSSIL